MKRIAVKRSLLFLATLLEAACLPAEASTVEDFNALYNQASIADGSKQYQPTMFKGKAVVEVASMRLLWK